MPHCVHNFFEKTPDFDNISFRDKVVLVKIGPLISYTKLVISGGIVILSTSVPFTFQILKKC